MTLTPEPAQPAYFEQLAGSVELLGAARSVLAAVITLADQVATLADVQLRELLTTLTDRAAVSRPLTQMVSLVRLRAPRI